MSLSGMFLPLSKTLIKVVTVDFAWGVNCLLRTARGFSGARNSKMTLVLTFGHCDRKWSKMVVSHWFPWFLGSKISKKTFILGSGDQDLKWSHFVVMNFTNIPQG